MQRYLGEWAYSLLEYSHAHAFENLLEAEQVTVLQCLKLILESNYIDDAEFQTRLGIDREELRQVIDAWPQLHDVKATFTTDLAINNCLNEVCNGIDVDDETLKNRYGISRETARQAFQNWKTAAARRLLP